MTKKVMDFDFEDYAKKCKYADNRGTEGSFYTHFENLLNFVFSKAKNGDYVIINNPISEKKEGHPDFQGEKNHIPFLRIEAKPPKYNLNMWIKKPDTDEDSRRMFKQIKKYTRTIDLILLITDFKTVWWVDTAELIEDIKKEIPIKYEFNFLNNDFTLHKSLSDDFERFKNCIFMDLETAKSNVLDLIDKIMPHVKELKTELMRIYLEPANIQEKELKKHLKNILSDFKKSIFSDFQDNFEKKFIDLYTQVMVYGMFMAWIRFSKGHRKAEVFGIDIISRYLPKGSLMQNLYIGVKNNLTENLYNNIFTPILKWFNRTEYTDLALIIDELMNEFYSGFLEKYDKQVKKDLGVVYTPKEVVDFMINGIDHLLTSSFQLKEGILNPNVKYLDPSAGTMAYPCALLELAYRKIAKEIDSDPNSFGTDIEKRERFSNWFRASFLRKEEGFANVFGFEILMAPYILGSLRVLMTAEKCGAIIDYSHDKVQMYLMNTLMDYPEGEDLDNFLLRFENPEFKNELKDSLQIRKKEDIMVIFTNPPYNISSQNSSKWITKLVNDYIKPENMEREVGKAKIKGITGLKASKDDYWKFLRFAQWKITENGDKHGIVSFITNNFYLDGIVARGLRKEYLKAFDKIFIINLNGDWRKAIPERANGSENGNIFDVNCGIAIIFAIRLPKEEHRKNKSKGLLNCEVNYMELWGNSASKLEYLKENRLENIQFTKVGENLDFEFTPHIQINSEYQSFPYLCEIFKKNIGGVGTGHDEEMIGYSVDEVKRLTNEVFIKYKNTEINDKNKMWNPHKILGANLENALNSIHKIAIRGWDHRYISYQKELIARPRFELMQYMLSDNNIAMGLARVSRKANGGSSVFVFNSLMELHAIEGGSGIGDYLFPLKINYSEETDDFNKPKSAIHSNISKKFIQSLPYWDNEKIDSEYLPISEIVFNYIYAILYSPTYRETYNGLLSKDFPRIPFPDSFELFSKMSELGKKLINIHLLKTKEVKNIKRKKININELDSSDYKIQKFAWIEKAESGMICFNTKKNEPDRENIIIEDISKEMWNFEIGGVLQLENWLKNRKYSIEGKKNTIPRGITQEELKYFLRVINAIEDTNNLLTDLDMIYNTIVSELYEFEEFEKNSTLEAYIKKED